MSDDMTAEASALKQTVVNPNVAPAGADWAGAALQVTQKRKRSMRVNLSGSCSGLMLHPAPRRHPRPRHQAPSPGMKAVSLSEEMWHVLTSDDSILSRHHWLMYLSQGETMRSMPPELNCYFVLNQSFMVSCSPAKR